MDEIRKFQAVPSYARETLVLIDMLKDGKVGDTLTAAALAERCLKNVKPGEAGYSNLQSAIRYVKKHHSVCWQWLKGEAKVKCLAATELVGRADSYRSQAKKKIRYAVGDLGIALNRGSELPDSERPHANALYAQTATLAALAGGHTTKTLESKGVNAAPDMRKLLEAWPA